MGKVDIPIHAAAPCRSAFTDRQPHPLRVNPGPFGESPGVQHVHSEEVADEVEYLHAGEADPGSIRRTWRDDTLLRFIDPTDEV